MSTAAPAPPLFLAVDIGTTSVKLLVVDARGTPRFEERVVIRLHHPRPAWAEIDAHDWWDAAAALIRCATEAVPAESVAAVGVTGLMHALVPVDPAGEPLDRALLWFDQRAHRQAAWLTQHWDDRLRASVGGPPGMNSAAPRLLWLREARPGLLERARCWLAAKDFVRFHLTGVLATDVTDAAGTGLTARGTGAWSHELVERVLELPLDRLPPIRQSAEIVGGVTEVAAKATGLRPGTPVVAGAADTTATLLGLDAFVPGRAILYLGTGVWMALSREAEGDEHPATHFLGTTATCGSSLVWQQRALGGVGEGQVCLEAICQAQEVAAVTPPGAQGVFFLPHLMGERGFAADPHARGVFFGLTLAHRAPHLLRAVVEGNAFQIRRALEHALSRPEAPPMPGSIVIAGGAARTLLWRQVLADVLGRAVQLPATGEATALGAAILAAVGVGFFPHPRAGASAWVHLNAPEPPDAARAAFYDRAYDFFCRLEAAVTPLYAVAAELEEGPATEEKAS